MDIDPLMWSRAARAALVLAMPTPGLEPAVFDDVPGEAIAAAALDNQIPAEVRDGARRQRRPDVADLLAGRVQAQGFSALRQMAELLELRRALSGAGIDSVVMKGLPLAALTRRDAFVRPSSDIDILIDPDALGAAHRALTESGARLLPNFPEPDDSLSFAMYRRFRHESGYVHRVTHLDLHWRLGGNFSLFPPASTVIGRAVSIQVGGHGVPAPCAEHGLLHATLHWQGMGFRKMKYVLDIEGLRALTDVGSQQQLPRSAKHVMAISAALVGSGADWSTLSPPSPRRWWNMAVAAMASPPPDQGSYAARRRRSFMAQLLYTPGVRDRVVVPLRSVAGPIARGVGKTPRRGATRP